ncbi:MAG TPA: PadR family transcriptional regulator [Pseudonocardiaceae bacterium]
MPVDPPETSYAVLGLVDKKPGASGHELARLAERSLAYFWPISRTLLYREIRRLEERGWVRGTEVRQERLPDRRSYTITAEGARVLSAWLERPGTGSNQFRSEFLLRFFFSASMSGEAMKELLADYRRALHTTVEELSAVADRLASVPGARTSRLAALHGVRTAQARLGWLDEVEAELP